MSLKSAKTILALVVALSLFASAFYFNFSRSAAQTHGPEMLSMNGGPSQPIRNPTYDISTAIVGPEVKAASFDKDLSTLPQVGPEKKKPMREMLRPANPTLGLLPDKKAQDPVLQLDKPTRDMPNPTANFKGMDLTNWGGGWPPDTHGAVGPNHYLQAVNTSMAIYNKTGTRLAAVRIDGSSFYSGTGTPCDTSGQGDPIALYDTYSGRFIVTEFAWTSLNGPFYQCIAVAKTADPVAGGWWFYGIQVSSTDLGDYPKFGIWPDGIYMGASMFYHASSYTGAKVWVFNRSDMISGAALRNVSFNLGSGYFSVFPSNSFVYNGAGAPPAGTPNFYFSDDNSNSSVEMWKFTVNWANMGASTFTGPTQIAVAPFSKPGVSSYVPQKGTSQKLDSLGDRLMSNFEYRNQNGAESVWLTRSVVNGSSTGIRWMEIRNPNGTPTVYQQGTYAPDTNYRWMPSLSVDKYGNMIVGYSVSSSSMYPAIRYAGRLFTDRLGKLSLGEATLIAGTGYQSSYSRWGDYSSMTVDPSDGCTFWYTTEYYEANGTNWQTRIGSIVLPGCTP